MKTLISIFLTAIFYKHVCCYLRVCYYTNWSQYRPNGGKFTPDDINPKLCSHIIYAFGKLDANTLVPFEWNDDSTEWSVGMYDKVNNLKSTNPNLRTLLAVGGWNAGSVPFSDMVATRASRRQFINSTLHYLRKRKFDGLDMDWEYPARRGGRPDDKANLGLLLSEMKQSFEQESYHTGRPRLLLTAAVPAGKANIDAGYDIPNVARSLDFINIMTYDLHGSWEPKTGHNSPLFSRTSENADDAILNMKWAVEYWAQRGAPKHKLVVGIGLYGRSFKLQSPTSNGIGAPAVGAGLAGRYTREPGFMSYYEVCEELKKGATRVWQAEHRAPYLHKGDLWVGYDDEESVVAKVRWMKQNKYGGIMVWSLALDDFSGQFCNKGPYPLLTAINKELGTVQDTSKVTKPDISTNINSAVSKHKPSKSPLQQTTSSTLTDFAFALAGLSAPKPVNSLPPEVLPTGSKPTIPPPPPLPIFQSNSGTSAAVHAIGDLLLHGKTKLSPPTSGNSHIHSVATTQLQNTGSSPSPVIVNGPGNVAEAPSQLNANANANQLDVVVPNHNHHFLTSLDAGNSKPPSAPTKFNSNANANQFDVVVPNHNDQFLTPLDAGNSKPPSAPTKFNSNANANQFDVVVPNHNDQFLTPLDAGNSKPPSAPTKFNSNANANQFDVVVPNHNDQFLTPLDAVNSKPPSAPTQFNSNANANQFDVVVPNHNDQFLTPLDVVNSKPPSAPTQFNSNANANQFDVVVPNHNDQFLTSLDAGNSKPPSAPTQFNSNANANQFDVVVPNHNDQFLTPLDAGNSKPPSAPTQFNSNANANQFDVVVPNHNNHFLTLFDAGNTKPPSTVMPSFNMQNSIADVVVPRPSSFNNAHPQAAVPGEKLGSGLAGAGSNILSTMPLEFVHRTGHSTGGGLQPTGNSVQEPALTNTFTQVPLEPAFFTAPMQASATSIQHGNVDMFPLAVANPTIPVPDPSVSLASNLAAVFPPPTDTRPTRDRIVALSEPNAPVVVGSLPVVDVAVPAVIAEQPPFLGMFGASQQIDLPVAAAAHSDIGLASVRPAPPSKPRLNFSFSSSSSSNSSSSSSSSSSNSSQSSNVQQISRSPSGSSLPQTIQDLLRQGPVDILPLPADGNLMSVVDHHQGIVPGGTVEAVIPIDNLDSLAQVLANLQTSIPTDGTVLVPEPRNNLRPETVLRELDIGNILGSNIASPIRAERMPSQQLDNRILRPVPRNRVASQGIPQNMIDNRPIRRRFIPPINDRRTGLLNAPQVSQPSTRQRVFPVSREQLRHLVRSLGREAVRRLLETRRVVLQPSLQRSQIIRRPVVRTRTPSLRNNMLRQRLSPRISPSTRNILTSRFRRPQGRSRQFNFDSNNLNRTPTQTARPRRVISNRDLFSILGM